MLCPNCGCEYRDGFTICADCNVQLVKKLISDASQETHKNELVPVFETYNQAEILVIKATLDAAGVIFHFSGDFSHIRGVVPTPARLLVASNQKKDVLMMLRDLEFIK
jgi:hypothetical protein